MESILSVDFSVPSLISPFKIRDKSMTKTILSVSINKQKRPSLSINSLTGSYIYQWTSKKNHQHNLSLLNISDVNFEETSTYSIDNFSQYQQEIYSDRLIPTSSYTYKYNNQDANKLKNHYFIKIHLESSGNILRTLANPLGFNKEVTDGNISYFVNLWNKQMKFSQYLKTSIDYRHYWKIDQKNSIAIRTMGGIIYAYGNNDQAPFIKKFIAGGANDLRAWQSYEMPNGRVQPDSENISTLYTGGVKFISCLEYRFNILKQLKGAVFSDAGNIWEIKSDVQDANFKWNKFIDDIAVNIGFGIRYDFQYFILRSDVGFRLREPYENKKWQWENIKIPSAQFNFGLGYPF